MLGLHTSANSKNTKRQKDSEQSKGCFSEGDKMEWIMLERENLVYMAWKK